MSAIRTVAIVGASLAGVSAAQTLRDEGFGGRIVMLGEEPHAPYERPELSKTFLRGERDVGQLWARPEGWYEDHGVELVTGVRATALDPHERSIAFEDGRTVGFDAAVLATGATNRRLAVPGADLPGVLQLRTLEDAERIRAAASGGGPVVVIGMGFIGAEVAASMRTLGVDVTVVEIFETAMWRVLGTDAGEAMARVHADHGVAMRFGETVEAFEGSGRVERVRTSAGVTIDCALAVVGIGVVPAAAPWSLATTPDGAIPAGPALETELPGVYAVGDVVGHRHPYLGRVRVEHYDHAVRSGATAARNLLGAGAVYDDPHWFWSDQFDVRIEMVGRPPVDGAVVVRGAYDDGSFCAFHLDRTGILRCAISVGWPRDVRRASALVRMQARPNPAALADPTVDLRRLP
jgi:3-phenylpropionate/trans-cinnamate dioxygenase ferredoxin reductase subunit